MVNTKINLCGIEISNPVIPASGTFGFGYYDQVAHLISHIKKIVQMMLSAILQL